MKFLVLIAVFLALGHVEMVLDNLVWLSIALTGPTLLGFFVVYATKAKQSDFSWRKPGHRLMIVGVAFSMFVSTALQLLYVVNHPSILA